MAILGLVVRKPDTVAGIRERLTERFPHSGWSSSIVYSDLRSLVAQGFLRMTEKGERRGEDRHESTPQGRVHFQEWLREGSEAAPALHDATRARLLLCEEEDLPPVLLLLRAEQKICADRFDAARWHLSRERRFGHLGPADGSEGSGRLLHALMVDDMLIWGNRALRLKRLLEILEGHDNDVEPDVEQLDVGDFDG